MVVYKDKEYGSKAEVVRELYDDGKVSLRAEDKKKLADELGMTVQTVHATIMKYIGKGSVSKTKKPSKKINVAITQVTNRINQKLARVKSGKGPIFVNDKFEEVQAELMKDPHLVKVWTAPNQWGLPVTIPPLYVIDENYDPNWIPPAEENIERNW